MHTFETIWTRRWKLLVHHRCRMEMRKLLL